MTNALRGSRSDSFLRERIADSPVVTAKQIIKQFLPPVLLQVIRGRRILAPQVTWDGVYAHLRDVPTQNANYDIDRRVQEFSDRTKEALALVAAGQHPSLGWHDRLGLLSAFVSARDNAVRILDFGGGVGLAFVELIATLRGNVKISYDVIELEMMCEAGRRLFLHDERIHFHSSLPTTTSDFDIVYISSVLPYIEDYRGLLAKLALLNARYILLTQLAAGNFQTYAARQLNLVGQVLPYWFLNISDIVDVFATTGYSLAYDGQSGPEYDQSNFPKNQRIGRMHDMLFVRTAER